ncbi:MAG: GNAT family N-acetyltransferase [Planctomycetota bacterium]
MVVSTSTPGMLDTDQVEVRTLNLDDLDWVVRIDAERSARPRRAYYELKLREAHANTGIRISLAARLGGVPAGFLMGRLYYGEFGMPEPTALLDSIGVARAFSGKHVGAALMRQLLMNLKALGVEKLHTQVEWNQWDLLRFFERSGFEPAKRVCLELAVAAAALPGDLA